MFIKLNIKMDNNESEAPQDFLVPSSIQRMMQTNRQCHALQTERSNASIKKTLASPKNSQADSDYTFEPRVNSSQRGRRSLDRFVEDQEKYQVEKERKLTEMREEITRWEDE